TERQAVPEFHTTQKGVRLATSVGGVLTGRGADFVIIDDPLKPDEALSDAQRTAANDWFDHTLYSRLNDKRTGVIIVIMQRLHEDDLTGHLLAKNSLETEGLYQGTSSLVPDPSSLGSSTDEKRSIPCCRRPARSSFFWSEAPFKQNSWKLLRLPSIAEHDEQ